MNQEKMKEEITKEEFMGMVKEAMQKHFEDDYTVMLDIVAKNNGQYRTGLVIKDKGINISPTIYLDSYYEEFRNGACLLELFGKIIRVYEEHRMCVDFDVNSLCSFEMVRERICFKVVNAGLNAQFLESVPHVLLHDLAVVFYVAVSMDVMGLASVSVNNRLAELWEMDADQLFCCAEANTQRLFPADVTDLLKFLSGKITGASGEEEPEVLEELFGCDRGYMPMYIATNREKTNGAAVMLYEGFLKGLAEKLDTDFYILPSSVHEILLVPVSADVKPEVLKDTVSFVNSQEVVPEEKLSDNIYYYNRLTDHVEMM